ncbi:hypothetical protein Q3W71_18745 [Micromonospora sp. C28SCA-DRY-2]|uniref:hypothetical protein n=1 Tax=Micromonospora sp. C28SCA-DRY-2 TaxID=3059522 RepID=UPI0026770923|nr:hypothetical protein [Micromonospora sp. C28SCA-DRY-2]MDO3703707.1 hypothetical protein [Micromonospora sp. C28SCA-DRY-2]
MPAPVAPADKRNPPLLTALFWIGVALAPVAALILLVADGNGPLRFAAVLAILAVVLIGLSIALRADGGGHGGTEELLDEIEQLRRELRGEIVAAAQRGNQALDQAQRAQEAVAGLRRRLDASSAALAGDDPAGAGRARVPAAEPADEPAAGRGRVPDEAAAGRGRVPEEPAPRWGQPERDDEEARRPQPASRYGSPGGVYGGGERPSAGVYGASRPAEPDPRAEAGARPLGVVRHTETVHVTTRHTIVDGAAGVPGDSGTRYGGGYAGRWAPGGEERSWGGAEPDSRSWSGYGDRDDDRGWSAQRDERDRSGQREDRGWSDRRDEPGWSDQRDDRGWAGGHARGGSAADGGAEPGWREPAGRGRSPQPDEDVEGGEYWSQLRAGDRWAAVRDDEHGREVRVGERRAEVLADAGGTEYRVADRWASARRGHDRDDAEGWREGWSEPEDRPALPVGGVPVPDEWRPPRQRGPQAEPSRGYQPEPSRGYQPEPQRGYQPEPEPERWRPRAEEQRYGYPPQDDAPRAGGARSADRWR